MTTTCICCGRDFTNDDHSRVCGRPRCWEVYCDWLEHQGAAAAEASGVDLSPDEED